MRDEEARDIAPPAPSYVRRVLADMPTEDQVWAEAEAKYGNAEDGLPAAASAYAAARFAGLYKMCRGLLEATEAHCERREQGRIKSLGIAGLKPVDPADLAEYEQAMAKAIPEIVKAVEERQALADEARQRTL